MKRAMKPESLKCAIGSLGWSKKRRKQTAAIGLGGLRPKAGREPQIPQPNNTVGVRQGSGSSKQVSRGHGDGRRRFAWMWLRTGPVMVGGASRACQRPAWFAAGAALWGCAGAPHDA